VPKATTRAADADTVLTACRLLVAISVRSLSAVNDEVSIDQLRILTVIASRPAATLSELATATGMHLSRASRACDRMVARGLLEREEHPEDRRHLRLKLTRQSRKIISDVARARRSSIEPALNRLGATGRAKLVAALDEFTAAGGEPAEAELWSMGWAT
jgi:DNA-binding MarR family transcriptional regulator